jgi:hypothetical protein
MNVLPLKAEEEAFFSHFPFSKFTSSRRGNRLRAFPAFEIHETNNCHIPT